MKPTFAHICCLLLLIGWVEKHESGAQSKQISPLAAITSLNPDVVLSGARPVRITIRGRAMRTLHSIAITDCDRKTISVKTVRGKTVTVDLPSSVLTRPCVLRVSPENDLLASLPLAVADPALARVGFPQNDPRGNYEWGGQFQRLNGGDEVHKIGLPVNATLVGISSNATVQGTFVLGKHHRVVERLQSVPSPQAVQNKENFVYLFLFGVQTDDVQWGPKDVEGFWIGTLSEDGKKITQWQPLSDMVEEPSGPLDNER